MPQDNKIEIIRYSHLLFFHLARRLQHQLVEVVVHVLLPLFLWLLMLSLEMELLLALASSRFRHLA
jgi:hypothetical protein